MVALLFMRFFPLVVRYLSGESPTVMHLLAAATFVTIALMIAVQELRADTDWGWVWRSAHLAIIAALYAGTWRIRRRHFLIAGLILQAATTALFVYNDMPDRDAAVYIPTLFLALLVPMQLLFLALRRLERAYPVWASMAIWRMARNPLQYSWLVLLIVMVTGLGVLATTVGGTLDRSYEERALYDVAADIRVTGIPTYFSRGTESLKEKYLELPGISSLSLVLRGGGSVGATYSGNSFGVLAVESDEFPYVSWYRDDFSERPLPQVMGLLKTGAGLPPIEVPRNADRIYAWAHPAEEYSKHIPVDGSERQARHNQHCYPGASARGGVDAHGGKDSGQPRLADQPCQRPDIRAGFRSRPEPPGRCSWMTYRYPSGARRKDTSSTTSRERASGRPWPPR